MPKPVVKRISSGIYDVEHNGLHYELESFPDGSWLLFSGKTGNGKVREYMNDFSTKRAALKSLEINA